MSGEKGPPNRGSVLPGPMGPSVSRSSRSGGEGEGADVDVDVDVSGEDEEAVQSFASRASRRRGRPVFSVGRGGRGSVRGVV